MESNNDNGISSSNKAQDFRTLIVTIMDYYCFNNGIIKDDYDSTDYSDNDDDDEEEEKWQRLTRGTEKDVNSNNLDNSNTNQVIPQHIHSLVEKAFESSLNKFID